MVSKSGRLPKSGRLFPRKKAYGYSKVMADPTDVREDNGNRPGFSEEPTLVKSVETSGIQMKTTMLANEALDKSSSGRTSKKEATGNRVLRQVQLFESLSFQNDDAPTANQAKKHGNKASKISSAEKKNKHNDKERKDNNKIQKEMTMLDNLVSGLAQVIDGRDEDSNVSSQRCRRDQMQKSKTNKKGGAKPDGQKPSSNRKSKNIDAATGPTNETSFVVSEITDATDNVSIYSARSITTETLPACGKASKFMEGMCYCQILDCFHG